MSLGVHFALSNRDLRHVQAINDADRLVDFIAEELEERYLRTDRWSFQSDKAWNAIHRCLTDGRLLYATGPFPLAYAVLGGATLNAGDDYTACLTSAAQVLRLNQRLAAIDRPWLLKRYRALSKSKYGPTSADDFEYTWDNFVGLRKFFVRAGSAERAVLFTTDC